MTMQTQAVAAEAVHDEDEAIAAFEIHAEQLLAAQRLEVCAVVDRFAVARALPALRRLERWSRPRVEVLHTAVAMRVVGFVLLALAVFVAWGRFGAYAF